MVKPTFLYIGASKAGSSWIFESLREHPDVFVPPAKDIQFFDRFYAPDKLDGYFAHFAPGTGKRAVGELSHNYFLFDECAERIHDALPDVKLLCCLREPVDKLIADYTYSRTTYLDGCIGFEEYCFAPGKIDTQGFPERGMSLEKADYHRNLSFFFSRFPAEQIGVFFFDELVENATDLAQRIYTFLDIDPTFRPGVLNTRVRGARQSRLPFLSRMAFNVAAALKKRGGANMVGKVKSSRLFNRLLFAPLVEKPDIPIELRRRVREHFEKDYDGLSAMIGRPLPPGWTSQGQARSLPLTAHDQREIA